MYVTHWTLVDYAYCHSINGRDRYKEFLKLYSKIRERGLPLTEKKILGLFYGDPSSTSLELIKDFMNGDFSPTHSDFAEEYILKSKYSFSKKALVKAVVGDMVNMFKIKKKDGIIEIPSIYFHSLINSVNTLLLVLIKSETLAKSEGSEFDLIRKSLRNTVAILSKGDLYQSKLE